MSFRLKRVCIVLMLLFSFSFRVGVLQIDCGIKILFAMVTMEKLLETCFFLEEIFVSVWCKRSKE